MRLSRPPKFTGLFHDESNSGSFWIRETGVLVLPALENASTLIVIGELRPATPGNATTEGDLGLELKLDGRPALQQEKISPGHFRLEIPWPNNTAPTGHQLELHLLGVTGSNFLAWLGRISRLGFLQEWRPQNRNRRLRILRVETNKDVLFDFSNRVSTWNFAVTRRSVKVGFNLIGFYRAILGVGESVRCAARAADAAGLSVACIELKLFCKNPQTDDTFTPRLQSENPHPVNVFHIDAPASRDIDHHHGENFRSGKYNIGYWAWELPEFPDSWIQAADYFDEIWTPSKFVSDAISQKVRIPVLTMPHAISFARPEGDFRKKFGLPQNRYLFLFLYDLNSYSERKNPAAVLEAFRRSGLAGKGAGLVVKIHNAEGNPTDYQRLRDAVAGVPDITLINQTLSRQEIYELESACDCFVSLHRSEGFGLAVAECMYLGKPVISTDWSATTEFITADNGCPVRFQLVTLDQHHGPYAKGQIWAAPDLDHAAQWMQRLFHDQEWGRKLGAAARATMEERYSPSAIGARYRQRLEVIAGW